MRAPFEIIEPAGAETPLVVEVPHAGLDLPPEFLEPLAAPVRAVARDADLYVDSLYGDAITEGATTLVARISRYIVDVNRSERDVDGSVVEGGRDDVRLHHGLVWRTTSDGEPALTRRLTRAELDERLDTVWRPYHQALARMIDRKRARFGIAVVLAAHSMPSVERMRAGADAMPRADVVPGTRGRTSAGAPFIEAVEARAREHGWTVRHDDPYAGGYTTQHYGAPSAGVHVVQVELARRLYLDEATLRPGAGFPAVRAWCRRLVAELGRVAVAATGA
jgi:N-formylglutamate amidohydrolase